MSMPCRPMLVTSACSRLCALFGSSRSTSNWYFTCCSAMSRFYPRGLRLRPDRAGGCARLDVFPSHGTLMRRRIVAGNWKLHGDRKFACALLEEIAAVAAPTGVERIVLPPLPYLGELVEHFGERGIQFGAQDVSANQQGAYTGEVSAAMLLDVGARYGLVGHSERRQYHRESSEQVAAKFFAAKAAGLTPILCVGESLHEREAGQTEWRIEEQLEPIFALGGAQALDGA